MSQGAEKADWIIQAHALSDDVTTEESALLAELAGVVEGWPASNVVARKALHLAAMQLVEMASQDFALEPG